MDFDRLNHLISEKGISKAFIASKLGKSRSLLTDWKNKKSVPSDCDLEIVAQLLDTTVDYLLGKTDKKNKPTAKSDELTERQKRYLDKIDRMTPAQLEMLEVFMNGLEKSDQ